jgi:hypothetical protein
MPACFLHQTIKNNERIEVHMIRNSLLQNHRILCLFCCVCVFIGLLSGTCNAILHMHNSESVKFSIVLLKMHPEFKLEINHLSQSKLCSEHSTTPPPEKLSISRYNG